MQPKNDSNEENRDISMALELYRLQSLRNVLVIILMIQILLVAIGLTMVFEANRLTPASRQLRSEQSTGNQEHERSQPGEVYRVPENQHRVA